MTGKEMEQIKALMAKKGGNLAREDVENIRMPGPLIDPDEFEEYGWIEEVLFLIENDTVNRNFSDVDGKPLVKT